VKGWLSGRLSGEWVCLAIRFVSIWLKDKIPESVLNVPKRGFAIPRKWYPVPSHQNKAQSLRYYLEASFVNPVAVLRITSEPKLFWKFLQLEQALEKGLF